MNTKLSISPKTIKTIVAIFAFVLMAILITGLLLSIVSGVATFVVEGHSENRFCIDESCLKYIFSNYNSSLKIVDITVDLLVAVTTIGGIIIALLGFINSKASNALANHIAHLQLFQDFIKQEIDKKQAISISSVDSFCLYNLMLPNSKFGDVETATAYSEAISDIEKEIVTSNQIKSCSNHGEFKYVEHQTRIISAFAKIGISLSRLPRNDFYEVEGHALEVIEAANAVFSPKENKFTARDYI